jgi:peptidoglycan hydrolase-like protein with peptidoglycan-binding domain
MPGMNPRTHPRGAPPVFTLLKPNPNPSRITDALWWLVQMRLLMEPGSRNGGTYANKPGSHNAGENLPATDHSLRPAHLNKTGPWWKEFSAAHDWTFPDAQAGDFTTIDKYTSRLINAMKDPNDPRPDNVVFYTLGQADNDRVVEGWNEVTDDPETGDSSHLWHRHDSFFRNAVGNFWLMWQVLTIDMGWTVAEWRRSLPEPKAPPMQKIQGFMPVLKRGMSDPLPVVGSYVTKLQRLHGITADGDFGPQTEAEVRAFNIRYFKRNDGIVDAAHWERLLGVKSTDMK